MFWTIGKESNIYNSDVICHNETKLLCSFTCLCTANICQYRIYSKEFFNDNLFSALAFSVKILLAGTCTESTISSKVKINYCLRQKFRMISYFEEASVAWKLCEVLQTAVI